MLQAVDHLNFVTSELDSLRAVSTKLVQSQPPASPQDGGTPAPDKLIKALEEMATIYGAIEEEFKRYLAIDFEGSATASGLARFAAAAERSRPSTSDI